MSIPETLQPDPPLREPVLVSALTAAALLPYLSRFPIRARATNEKGFYPAIFNKLHEVFGDIVHEQLPVAHGNTLKIDFHLGDPLGHGVGIEVKVPTNNADVQRALGHLDQYQRRYSDNLILFVIQDFLKPEILIFFLDGLRGKGIATVVR